MPRDIEVYVVTARFKLDEIAALLLVNDLQELARARGVHPTDVAVTKEFYTIATVED